MTRRLIVPALALLATGCALGPNYQRPRGPAAAHLARDPRGRGPEPGQHALVGAVRRSAAPGAHPHRARREQGPQDRGRAHRGGAGALRLRPRRTSGPRWTRTPPPAASASTAAAWSIPPRGISKACPTGRRPRSTPSPRTCRWEIDFFGRVRRATEAAARRCSSAPQEARRAAVLTLVADVARAYFELRDFDRRLEIARRTIAVAPASTCSSPRTASRAASPPRWTSARPRPSCAASRPSCSTWSA